VGGATGVRSRGKNLGGGCPYSDVPKRPPLWGLVVRVAGYRSRGPGSIPGATRLSGTGPLGLVSRTEWLLGRKSSGSGLEIRE
jgi:hypothetical protein